MNTRQEVFPQGEAKRKKNAIFKQLVSKDRLHPYFQGLMDEEAYSPAREIIREIAYAFEDPDGNYIEQFQSTGFNARLWELYLYAFLHEEGFTIHRNFSAPDYICEKFGHNVCIEAVTVNPTGGTEPDEPPPSPEEVQERSRDYMPIKFGSVLFSKLRRRYWEKKHVAGHPLIFAIEDFHQPGSLLWSRTALLTYLYGYHHTWGKDKNGKRIIIPEKIETHQYGDKKIPSGFFFLPEAENVSVVLFSNSATISKFNRMGKLAEFGSPRVRMLREGTCHNHDPNAAEPLRFVVEVNPSSYDELWGEGLSMYHNPQAAIPADPALFPNIAHHWFEDGQIAGDLPEFFPYGSVTHIWIEQEP